MCAWTAILLHWIHDCIWLQLRLDQHVDKLWSKPFICSPSCIVWVVLWHSEGLLQPVTGPLPGFHSISIFVLNARYSRTIDHNQPHTMLPPRLMSPTLLQKYIITEHIIIIIIYLFIFCQSFVVCQMSWTSVGTFLFTSLQTRDTNNQIITECQM